VLKCFIKYLIQHRAGPVVKYFIPFISFNVFPFLRHSNFLHPMGTVTPCPYERKNHRWDNKIKNKLNSWQFAYNLHLQCIFVCKYSQNMFKLVIFIIVYFYFEFSKFQLKVLLYTHFKNLVIQQMKIVLQYYYCLTVFCMWPYSWPIIEFKKYIKHVWLLQNIPLFYRYENSSPLILAINFKCTSLVNYLLVHGARVEGDCELYQI
jgi:hypothetical protein